MTRPAALSVMLALDDVPTAVVWYREALGANLRWDLDSVAEESPLWWWGLRVSGEAA